MKATWNTINEVINRRKCKTLLPWSSSFKAAGKTGSGPAEIVNEFCDYFTNIGPNLAAKIPIILIQILKAFLKTDVESPLIFSNQLHWEEGSRFQQYFKKNSKNLLEPNIHSVLLHIINLSLSTGIFPDKLKIAKIISI